MHSNKRDRVSAPHLTDSSRLLLASVQWTPNVSIPAPFTDHVVVNSFNGILTHSSKITSAMHDRILALPPATTKIVIVGLGKSAVDLGGIYGGLGRDVTMVFRSVCPRLMLRRSILC